MHRRYAPALFAVLLSVSLVGCGSADGTVTEEPEAAPPSSESPTAPEGEPSEGGYAWLEIDLTNVVSGEQFRLTDFKGTPVLLHPFAAW